MMERLKLPKGIHTFEELRTGGYVYVDKTKYLIDLIDNGKSYFLSRPRRFGKSLTVSTFEALFLGKKELFQGLSAEEFLNRPDFQPSPVIRLDMSRINTSDGIDGVKESIFYLTKEIAREFNVALSETKVNSVLFSDLIQRTAEKYNQKVVVIVDEYDKPYTDFVNDREMADKVRNVLRDYYVQIKANDQHIRFVFITGISKFVKMGVFSTFNNLEDVSMMPEYAEICGYTEDEIIRYFPDYLNETADRMKIQVDALIERMRQYYNGFCFDREAHSRLYNPFSTLLFFSQKNFSNYWIESGSTRFIAEYMRDRCLTVDQFRNMPVSERFAQSPGDMDTTRPEGFLYQGGYLTLRPGISDFLSLDYPNTEVLNSMSELLAQNILRDSDDDFTYCRSDLLKGLMNRDYRRIIGALNRLLASIPYDDFSNAARQSISYNDYDFDMQEWLYRSTILAFLRGCGVVVVAEMHTNRGRPDLVVTHKGQTYIIELKVADGAENAEKKADEALRQCADGNYTQPFPDAACLCLCIDNETRRIAASRVRQAMYKYSNNLNHECL